MRRVLPLSSWAVFNRSALISSVSSIARSSKKTFLGAVYHLWDSLVFGSPQKLTLVRPEELIVATVLNGEHAEETCVPLAPSRCLRLSTSISERKQQADASPL